MIRKTTIFACVPVLLAFLLGQASGATINELRIDQPGTDNDEYFELFGSANESLDDLTYIVIGDGAGGSGTVEDAVSLAGNSIPSGGYFLAAEDTFSLGGVSPDLITPLNFENSDNVTHLLVSDFSGAVGDDLDTDDDCVLDATPWSAVIDGLALIEEVGGGDCEYATDLGLPVVGPDGTFVPGHAYAFPNGSDTYLIGAFDPVGGNDTPRAANVPEPSTFLITALALFGVLSGRRVRR